MTDEQMTNLVKEKLGPIFGNHSVIKIASRPTNGMTCWTITFDNGSWFHLHEGYPEQYRELLPEGAPEIRFRTTEGAAPSQLTVLGVATYKI